MSFNNKIPNMGRESQEVRDSDFITLVGLKAFDDSLNAIVTKLSDTESSNSASNIVEQLKAIEYNLADAVTRIKNADGTYSYTYNTTVDSVTGETVPKYGKEAVETLETQLETYYQELLTPSLTTVKPTTNLNGDIITLNMTFSDRGISGNIGGMT